jgi:hypothetical protein
MTKYVLDDQSKNKKREENLFNIEIENINLSVKDSIFDKSQGSQNDVYNLKKTLELIERKKTAKINEKKSKKGKVSH